MILSLQTARDLLELVAHAGEGGIGLGEPVFGGRIDEQTQRPIEIVVAGRAFDGPIGAQLLVRRKNFLDHEIERLSGALAQRLEIRLRVEQPVDMVDSKPFDLIRLEHAEHARMGVLEDRREFHAQACKIVDVEEAPVVDFVFGHAMKGDAPELRADQGVQFPPIAVDRGEPGVDAVARVCDQPARAPPVPP